MEEKFTNEIRNNGLVEVEGMEFHDIEGGFGKNKKSMLAKDISKIHNMKLKVVNQNINRNKKRFTQDVDIIDLKNGHSKLPLQDLGFSDRDISISKNIYLLSERGYSKLLKILEDDFAWEQYEKLVDSYFNMRAREKENKVLSPMEILELQLKIVSEQNERIDKIDSKINYIENRVEEKVISLEDNMPLFNVECDMIQKDVKKKGIQVLGGYKSNAYNDKSIRAKVYFDIQAEIKRNLNVSTYKGIKRGQLNTAQDIIRNYVAPIYLLNKIYMTNSEVI